MVAAARRITMIYQAVAKVFLICSNSHCRPGERGIAQTMTADTYWIYILASRQHGALYIGVTHNLRLRLGQHRAGFGSEIVKKYGGHRLVYVEAFATAREAIAREK
jgi:putative endonuclease